MTNLKLLLSIIHKKIIIWFFLDEVKLPKSIRKLNEEYKFNENQLREIKKGIVQSVNVTEYAKPYFSYDQMEQLRLGLLQKVDISLYKNRYLSATRMSTIRRLNIIRNEEKKKIDKENI